MVFAQSHWGYWIIICGYNDCKRVLMRNATHEKTIEMYCNVGRLVGRTHFMRSNGNPIQFVRTNVQNWEIAGEGTDKIQTHKD